MRDKSVAARDRGGEYLRMLRQQWKLVVAGLTLGLAVASAVLLWAPREYRAVTDVLVTPTIRSSGTLGGSATLGLLSTPINLDTEAKLVTSTDTVAGAAERLGISTAGAGDLAARVGINAPANTDILRISFTADTAELAQRGSVAFAEAYLDQRRAAAQAALDEADQSLQTRMDAVGDQLAAALGGPDGPSRDLQVAALDAQLATLAAEQNAIRAAVITPGRIVTQAPPPSAPSSPDRLVTITAGIALGLLAGVGMAAARQRSDGRLRTPADVHRSTGLPVAAVLSEGARHGERAVVSPLSTDGRSYARLRNLVLTELATAGRPVVLVAGIREGTGSVAVNLAVSLARAGEDVVLVCADVRTTASAVLLEHPTGTGLAEVLEGRAALAEAVRPAQGISNLRILGAGGDHDRARALLEAGRGQHVVEELLQMAGCIVVEAPPTADSPTAQILAPAAGAAILTVELGRTTSTEVVEACELFESTGTPVVGAVVVQHRNEPRRSGRRRAAGAGGDPGPARAASAGAPGPEGTPAAAQRVRAVATVGDGTELERSSPPQHARDAVQR